MKYRLEAFMPRPFADGWEWRNISGNASATRNKAIRMASLVKRNDMTKKVRIRRAA